MQRTREQRSAQTSGDGVQERLHAMLDAGRRRARSLGRPVLVSTTEITGVAPLDALDPRSTQQMYWASPADDFAIAGIGAAITLTGNGDARFHEVARAWERLLADAERQVGGNSASGPVLMGGFAFEADGPATPRWKGFEAASFTVPRLSVTRARNACWLTLNAIVADEDVETQLRELAQARAKVLERSASPGDATYLPPSETAHVRVSARDGKHDLDDAAQRWRAVVQDAVQVIRDGGLEKVVLAREVTVPVPAGFDPLDALRHLAARHPATFIYAVWRGDAVFFGASPERLVREHGRDVSTSVLAGSIARGATPGDDALQAAALLAGDKDRQEHEIVRREIERALMPVCDAVVIDLEPTVMSLAHMHHLHTSVRARLEDGRSVFDVVERLHPTPAVGGTPKEAALAFIREREDMDRGWYAAPVGWVSATSAEFAVALRCALVRRRRASLFAGCGIVAQSDPETEYQESEAKLRAAREALVVRSVAPAAAGS